MPVTRRSLCAPLGLLLSFLACAAAPAQDMRVYTTVNDVSREGAASRAVSHSLTLFHAGKVYDYMEEVGEVVIFEPDQHRFIILSRGYAATEVPFSELNHDLETAHDESLRYLEKLARENDPKSARMSTAIRFQLQPEFQETFDAGQQRLSLSGACLSYAARTAAVDNPAAVRQYLDYADWAARLNYVLHPHSAFPESRLKLNEALRQRDRLPTQVDLTLQLNEPLKLRAAHTFSWEFQSVDRKHINHWDRMLHSDQVRWMTFREYQQQLVAQKSR